MIKRVFCIVLDSFGIGGAADAAAYGDEGSNTLAAIQNSTQFAAPNMASLGLFNIPGVQGPAAAAPTGAFARLAEQSAGKDTIIGHWELAGLVSEKPMPTYPQGLPQDMLAEFSRRIGRGTLCGLPYSGTEVLKDYGEEHMKTGKPIVYTSGDSVFQIAAHEEVVPLEELYRWCEEARDMLRGDWALGRVIARPFLGTSPADFKRTPNRHDYALAPFAPTVLDALSAAGKQVIGVGKIYDIFAGQGVTRTLKTTGNPDGMEKTTALQQEDFEGFCFVNLVDFDMVYGHRNDIDGYAGAITAFDTWLGGFLSAMREDDLLLLTADHGCDPSTPSTDHSRENVPLLVAGKAIQPGTDLGTRQGFGSVANIVAGALGLPAAFSGQDLWPQLKA